MTGQHGAGLAPLHPEGGGVGTPRSGRRTAVITALLAAAALLISGSAWALATGDKADVPRPASRATNSRAAIDPLSLRIDGYQTRLQEQPDDWQTWANLGLSYVEQARVTVNPAYYPKAEGALKRSLGLHPRGNFLALAGRGTLAAARHDFAGALRYTRAAARINPYNVTIFGAMADAQTQLGRYAAARRSIARMMELHPGTPAFARLSYAEELAGRVPSAEGALRRALETASTPADRAFAYYYLGELAFNNGRLQDALRRYRQGLQAFPGDTASLAGRAKAEAALGRHDAAVADYTTVVNRVPQPQYVLELGELLQSLGRDAEAKAQYAVFTDELRVFRANGVATDLEPAQFYADHGNPAAAVRYARAGVRQRPFLEMQDALAWALHQAGDDRAALRVMRRAMSTGLRSALFHFHAGMIEKALGMRAAARADLRTALAINPYFSPLRAPVARSALRELAGRS